MSSILFRPNIKLSEVANKFRFIPNTCRFKIYSYLDKRSVLAIYSAFKLARNDILAHPQACTFLRANQLKSVVWTRARDFSPCVTMFKYHFSVHAYYFNPRSPLDWRVEFQKERIIKGLSTYDFSVPDEPLPFLQSSNEKEHHLITASSKSFYLVQEKVGGSFEDRVYDLSKKQVILKDKLNAEAAHLRTRRRMINGTDFEILISNDLKEIKVWNLSKNRSVFTLTSDVPLDESSSHIIQNQDVFLFKVYKKSANGNVEAETVLWEMTFNKHVRIKNLEFLDDFCTERGKTTLIAKPEKDKEIVIHEVDWSNSLAQVSTTTNSKYDGKSTLELLNKNTIFVRHGTQSFSILNTINSAQVTRDCVYEDISKFIISKAFQKILISSENQVHCIDFKGNLLKTFQLPEFTTLHAFQLWEHRAGLFYYQRQQIQCISIDLSNILSAGIQIDRKDVIYFYDSAQCSGGLCLVRMNEDDQQVVKVFDLKDMALVRAIPLQDPEKLMPKGFKPDAIMRKTYLINGIFVDSICGNKKPHNPNDPPRQFTRTLTYSFDPKASSSYLTFSPYGIWV